MAIGINRLATVKSGMEFRKDIGRIDKILIVTRYEARFVD